MANSKFIAIDIETTGLDYFKDRILCVGFSDGYFFECSEANWAERVQKRLDEINYNGGVVVGQNLSFDTKFLWHNGVRLNNEWDTMVAAYLLTDKPSKLSLDSLVSYYLGLPSWKDDFKSGAAYTDPELMKLYCLTDCKYTLKLAEVLEEKLKEESKEDFFYKLMRARRMLTRAEYHGVAFDVPGCQSLIKTLSEKYEEQLAALNAYGAEYIKHHEDAKKKKPKAFNWNSPAQIKWLLKDQLKLNTINPITKKDSADAFVLEMNASKHPLIPHILKMRETRKLMSTLEGYIEALSLDGRLHPNFNVTNTITGRLSSSGALNIQQVDSSQPVRSLFKAEKGKKLIIGDLAQIEPRMAAHYSKDPVLCAMFNNEEDLYGTIACQILGAECSPNEVKEKYPEKRKIAKVIGLSVLYGIGVNKLTTMIQNDGGIAGFTINQARQIIDNYFTKFAGLRDLQTGVHKAIVNKGHVVNYEGRKVDVSEDKVHRDGVNSLLQSSASDYLLFKVTQFEEVLATYGANVIMLVHDEVVIEAPEQHAEACAKSLKAHIETPSNNFRVPIKFEVAVGDNWGCKK